jgi:hypothetical protein
MNKLFKNKISIYFFIIVLILAIGYAYYQTKSFTLGPILEITEPKNGTLLNTNSVTVKGYAENISHITINDRPVFIDEEGHLNEKILLSLGYNVIRVSAKDKYKREVEKKLELIFHENTRTLEH